MCFLINFSVLVLKENGYFLVGSFYLVHSFDKFSTILRRVIVQIDGRKSSRS
ncbi:hypothetical protein ACE6H2_005542 [Prunus campanulata]